MFNYILLSLHLIKIVCWLAVGATKESKTKIGINGWEDWGSWGSGGDKEGGKGGGGGGGEEGEHNGGERIKGSGRYKGCGEDDESGIKMEVEERTEVDSIVKIGELGDAGEDGEVSFLTKMVGVGDDHEDQTHELVY